MQSWYHIFPKNTGLSPYVWLIFCILPFYFIFRSSSMLAITFGIIMIICFFIAYGFAFVSKGWPVYVWTGIQIVISIGMTITFGYIYFSLFLAFFIGNVQNKVGFFVLYTIQLVTAIISINIGFIRQDPIFYSQFPFMFICLVGVILLPFNTYNRNKRGKLEEQLEDANKRITELGKIEERQRIARDLHDTLGQKLSLIGLKSDLAGKLIDRDPETAKNEIKDIRQTASRALKEVREMVSEMRGVKVEEEALRIVQILKAAGIEFEWRGPYELKDTPPFVETVISMCMKEAVTNVVKHSRGDFCVIDVLDSDTGVSVNIRDNGNGFDQIHFQPGNGLQGMKERLEFVNGSLEIESGHGTVLSIHVPKAIKNHG